MTASVVKTDAAGLPWEVYICRACGLLYDESKGDEDSGLAAGTRFADIPDDWACPLCGVTKSDFELYAVEPARQTSSLGGASRSQVLGGNRTPGVVIVGAGRAGWQMAQALRTQDAAIPITMVTACNGDVYDKPLLSVAMARGIDVDTLPRETGFDAARRLNVKLLAHTQAVRITPASQQLRTSRGTLRYRHLVLAHGAEARQLTPFTPALCWRINHLGAYTKFRAALGQTPQHIAVVGAGLVGCELANDLALGGHTVSLLDVAPRPLAASLTPEQSAQLLAAWAALPLTFFGGVDVAQVALVQQDQQAERCRDNPTKRLTTACGQVFQVDQIVVAAGLQTPHTLAASAGLAWNNGIAVHPASLATSVVGVHALGDCIAINGKVSRYIEPIGRQAKTVASNILGGVPVPYVVKQVPLRIKTTSWPLTV